MGKPIGRRAWLRVAAATMCGPSWGRAGFDDETAGVEARANAVGLGPFARSESEHYLAIGDAEKAFRDDVVAACEAIATGFLKHYQARGFDVALPKQRMIVVVLAGAKSYAKFAGEEEGLSVGGHYEPSTNRLVVFDYRSVQGGLAADARRINSFTLSHETNHQLTFNTGLLDRTGDVPVCISEGLAAYGETWTWAERGADAIGRVNHPRLKGILEATASWIPMARLFVEDRVLEAEPTRVAAYAESWTLVHYHMKDPARLPKFRAYLAAIRGRKNANERLVDARAHLGDLEKLDAALRRYTKYPRGR